MPQIQDFKKSVLNSAANGAIQAVTGAAGMPIRIWAMTVNSLTATTVTFQDQATALSGPIALGATTTLIFPYTGAPWYDVSPGNNFVIENGSAVQLSGTIYYTLGG